MAVYPAGNPGVYPVNYSTATGVFRLRVNDVTGTAYDPASPGYANFVKISDAEIEVFLTANGNSVNLALADYYDTLAGDAASQSMSVKDHDLAINMEKRAADLRAQAQVYRDKAKEDDLIAGTADIFETHPFGSDFLEVY